LFPIQGIEYHNFEQLPLVSGAGVYWARRNALLWSEIEPEEGQRQWGAAAALEREMIASSISGLQLIMIVRSTPPWAQKIPGVYCGPVAPEKLVAFGQWMSEVVARYSVPPYNIKYWELGNEPDIDVAAVQPTSVFGCWGDAADPYYGGGYYAEMLKVVYPRIKEADPNAQVLVGGLLLDCDPVQPPETAPGSGQARDCAPARFTEGILANGGGDYFDGISFHAYDYYYGEPGVYGNPNWHSMWNTTGPTAIAKTRYLRGLLLAYQRPEKYLLNTEMALICGRDGSEPICQADDFARTKAAYLVHSNVVAWDLELRANIWYALTGWRASSLLGPGGQTLPAYDALRFNAFELGQATLGRIITDYVGVQGYEFVRSERRIWVLWALSHTPQTVQLPALPVAAYDYLGQPVGISQVLELTWAPVYIEW
jgi:hypothetical protein